MAKSNKLLFIHGGTLAKDEEELFQIMQERTIDPFEEKKNEEKP